MTIRPLMLTVAAVGAALGLFAAAVDLHGGGVVFPWWATLTCAILNGLLFVVWWRW